VLARAVFIDKDGTLVEELLHKDMDRGRDTHCWTPPAQIPAGVIHALGSYLGCVTAKRCSGHG